jgi:hypothetical protein
MATFNFAMTTWGSPSSPKRALLVHSALASGLVWFKVAQHLVAAGELVLYSGLTEGYVSGTVFRVS